MIRRPKTISLVVFVAVLGAGGAAYADLGKHAQLILRAATLLLRDFGFEFSGKNGGGADPDVIRTTITPRANLRYDGAVAGEATIETTYLDGRATWNVTEAGHPEPRIATVHDNGHFSQTLSRLDPTAGITPCQLIESGKLGVGWDAVVFEGANITVRHPVANNTATYADDKLSVEVTDPGAPGPRVAAVVGSQGKFSLTVSRLDPTAGLTPCHSVESTTEGSRIHVVGPLVVVTDLAGNTYMLDQDGALTKITAPPN